MKRRSLAILGCLLLGGSYGAVSAVAQSSTQGSAAALERVGVVTEPIVGGGPARRGENGWISSLQDGGSHFCGASLIADRWVLTAAHCLEDTIASETTVWIGGYNQRFPGQGTTVPVSKIFVHENYDMVNEVHDIALLELAEAAPASLPRVMLPTTEVMSIAAAPGDLVTVSGWGVLSEGGRSPSRLHEVVLPVVSNSACNAPQAYDGEIQPSMICAGLRSGGKDSCQGDSGGPLWVEYQQEKYLVGIVSFGEGCALANKYGVYTRVVSYLPWIEEIQAGGDGGGTPDEPCTQVVCSIDAFCCEVEFDEICQDIASQQCDTGGGGPQCLDKVCAVDSYCCEVEFDSICQEIADRECAG